MAFLDIVPAAAAELNGQASDKPSNATQLVFLRAAAQTLAKDEKTEKVGKPLVSMIDAAENDATKLKKSVEDWYNSSMDRVSGWYKYRTQWILFIIGLVLAVALNADAVSILRQLSKDSTLRQSIVAAAQSAKQPDSKSNQPIKDQIEQAQQTVKEFDNLGIQLGWDKKELPNSWQDWLGLWDLRLWKWWAFPGWLLTGIAVSLGAPFWFDILNKIMVVRSTVKPREKSHEEQSKDKTKDEANDKK